MPRFQSSPPITGLTMPDGTAFTADENGVFEIDLNALYLAAFQNHGVKLEMVPEPPPEPPSEPEQPPEQPPAPKAGRSKKTEG